MLPDWLPKETWNAFIEMRKEMGAKHKATEHAQVLLIKKLDRMRKEGQDIEAVINESIMRSWTGLFPLKATITYQTANEKQKSFADRLTGNVNDQYTPNIRDIN